MSFFSLRDILFQHLILENENSPLLISNNQAFINQIPIFCLQKKIPFSFKVLSNGTFHLKSEKVGSKLYSNKILQIIVGYQSFKNLIETDYYRRFQNQKNQRKLTKNITVLIKILSFYTFVLYIMTNRLSLQFSSRDMENEFTALTHTMNIQLFKVILFSLRFLHFSLVHDPSSHVHHHSLFCYYNSHRHQFRLWSTESCLNRSFHPQHLTYP